MPPIIDSDQHLYEYRSLWTDHIDPRLRDDAIRFAEDRLGHVRVVWRDTVLTVADVQLPGETDAIGERRRRERAGEPPLVHYDEALPEDYWDPSARLARLADLGVDETLLFPNYGLAWERKLQADLPALCGNMRAWNRWCETVAEVGAGRLHPVAHLTLRDLDWLESEIERISRSGVRAAMIAPSAVDGKPLSHPALDRAWAALAHHQITPVFHVADQPRPFDDAWYPDDADLGVTPVDAVHLHVGASLACTDLILHGVLELVQPGEAGVHPGRIVVQHPEQVGAEVAEHQRQEERLHQPAEQVLAHLGPAHVAPAAQQRPADLGEVRPDQIRAMRIAFQQLLGHRLAGPRPGGQFLALAGQRRIRVVHRLRLARIDQVGDAAVRARQ